MDLAVAEKADNTFSMLAALSPQISKKLALVDRSTASKSSERTLAIELAGISEAIPLGGLPRAAVVELASPQGLAQATSLALATCAAAQAEARLRGGAHRLGCRTRGHSFGGILRRLGGSLEPEIDQATDGLRTRWNAVREAEVIKGRNQRLRHGRDDAFGVWLVHGDIMPSRCQRINRHTL